MNSHEYDLVVIGSGPAGQKGAICAAKLRKKVAIIDRIRTMGGVCVHTGTIPSKTLREAVLYLSGFRQRSFYGRGYVLKDRIAMSDLTFRALAVMAREVEVIKAQLRRNYVTTLEGEARFIDPHTIEIKNEEGVQLVRGGILVACGTRPAHSSEFGSMANGFSIPTSSTPRMFRANWWLWGQESLVWNTLRCLPRSASR